MDLAPISAARAGHGEALTVLWFEGEVRADEAEVIRQLGAALNR